MEGLSDRPKVKRIAGRLGLPVHGDCAGRIQRRVLNRVARIVETFPVESLKGLMRLVADRLSVHIERVRSNDDLDNIISRYKECSQAFPLVVREEFLSSETEGLLLGNPCRERPGERQRLALIDVRGRRQHRAYFTIWHELAHMLMLPADGLGEGTQFRRAPTEEQKETDPEEHLADRIAGQLAFYEPLFRPALNESASEFGTLNFNAIARANERAAPAASLFATARACVRLADQPACLVEVAPGLKKRARRRCARAHGDLFGYEPEKQLRIKQCIRNQPARESGLELRRNMRVPRKCILMKAQESKAKSPGLRQRFFEAEENQDWWETSREGPLSPLPLRVCAARRGSYVYGLIFPQSQ